MSHKRNVANAKYTSLSLDMPYQRPHWDPGKEAAEPKLGGALRDPISLTDMPEDPSFRQACGAHVLERASQCWCVVAPRELEVDSRRQRAYGVFACPVGQRWRQQGGLTITSVIFCLALFRPVQ